MLLHIPNIRSLLLGEFLFIPRACDPSCTLGHITCHATLKLFFDSGAHPPTMMSHHCLSYRSQLCAAWAYLLPEPAPSLPMQKPVLWRSFQMPRRCSHMRLDLQPELIRVYTSVLNPLPKVKASTMTLLLRAFWVPGFFPAPLQAPPCVAGQALGAMAERKSTYRHAALRCLSW